MLGGMANARRYGGRHAGRRTGLWVAGAVLTSAATVAGCGGPETPTVPARPSDGPVRSGEPAPTELLVELNVSGGLAGVSHQLIVRYDGSYTTRSGTEPPRTGRMTPAEVAELRAALEDPAYAAVPARPSGGPVYDGFQYVISYRHRVVVTTDGDRPPALRRVFEALPGGGPPTGP